MEITIDAQNAPQKVLSTPGVKFAANCKTSPFITKVNNPRVKKLIGNVKNNNKGLIKTFNIPKITTKTIAQPKDFTLNPGIR